MTHTAGFSGFWFTLLANRTQLELRGADRALFLHNFCTQEIKKMLPGSGGETFITSHQGKALGYGNLFCEQDRLLFDTVPGEAEKLRTHLDRFVITEQVEFHDRSAETSVFCIAGDKAEASLQKLLGTSLPEAPLSHATITFTNAAGSFPLTLRRSAKSLIPCFYLAIDSANVAEILAQLLQAGASERSLADYDAFRILANIPQYNSEVFEDNLPQEIDRDATAISFKKGCYLGQETIARLDALGHVNRLLRRVQLTGNEPPVTGTELFLDEKPVGKILSAATYPAQQLLAFAMVRRLQAKAGTTLTLPGGSAFVLG